MNKDNYHEQGNIIIMLLLLPLGHISNSAHPAEPGHNRSSSPGAALADITECKAAKHRSRANPTFYQRHDSELMHIRPNSRRRTLPKVFGLYEDGPKRSPW